MIYGDLNSNNEEKNNEGEGRRNINQEENQENKKNKEGGTGNKPKHFIEGIGSCFSRITNCSCCKKPQPEQDINLAQYTENKNNEGQGGERENNINDINDNNNINDNDIIINNNNNNKNILDENKEYKGFNINIDINKNNNNFDEDFEGNKSLNNNNNKEFFDKDKDYIGKNSEESYEESEKQKNFKNNVYKQQYTFGNSSDSSSNFDKKNQENKDDEHEIKIQEKENNYSGIIISRKIKDKKDIEKEKEKIENEENETCTDYNKRIEEMMGRNTILLENIEKEQEKFLNNNNKENKEDIINNKDIFGKKKEIKDFETNIDINKKKEKETEEEEENEAKKDKKDATKYMGNSININDSEEEKEKNKEKIYKDIKEEIEAKIKYGENLIIENVNKDKKLEKKLTEIKKIHKENISNDELNDILTETFNKAKYDDYLSGIIPGEPKNINKNNTIIKQGENIPNISQKVNPVNNIDVNKNPSGNNNTVTLKELFDGDVGASINVGKKKSNSLELGQKEEIKNEENEEEWDIFSSGIIEGKNKPKKDKAIKNGDNNNFQGNKINVNINKNNNNNINNIKQAENENNKKGENNLQPQVNNINNIDKDSEEEDEDEEQNKKNKEQYDQLVDILKNVIVNFCKLEWQYVRYNGKLSLIFKSLMENSNFLDKVSQYLITERSTDNKISTFCKENDSKDILQYLPSEIKTKQYNNNVQNKEVIETIQHVINYIFDEAKKYLEDNNSSHARTLIRNTINWVWKMRTQGIFEYNCNESISGALYKIASNIQDDEALQNFLKPRIKDIDLNACFKPTPDKIKLNKTSNFSLKILNNLKHQNNK